MSDTLEPEPEQNEAADAELARREDEAENGAPDETVVVGPSSVVEPEPELPDEPKSKGKS